MSALFTAMIEAMQPIVRRSGTCLRSDLIEAGFTERQIDSVFGRGGFMTKEAVNGPYSPGPARAAFDVDGVTHIVVNA